MIIAIGVSVTSNVQSLVGAFTGGMAGVLISLLLVVVLSLRVLISASSLSSKKKLRILDTAVVPLVLLFAASLVFQIMELVEFYK